MYIFHAHQPTLKVLIATSSKPPSISLNISKEVKFVKAKELMVVDSTVEKANVEKKKNVTDQRVLNKPHNRSVVRFKEIGRAHV